ncbi:MAG: hypothetical protein ACE5OZ_19120 [Candidatus Heimdallarchaeota archaeon]
MSGNESNRGLSLRGTLKRLAEGKIPKPLNANLLHHQKSFLLHLERSTAIYEARVTKKRERKKGSPELCTIRGLRGLFRQQMRAKAQKLGIALWALSPQEAF